MPSREELSRALDEATSGLRRLDTTQLEAALVAAIPMLLFVLFDHLFVGAYNCWVQAEKVQQMLAAGLLFARPDGKHETADERDRRLAHNARMRFNRSFESSLARHTA